MMNNLHNPRFIAYTAITTVDFNVALGAAGWVDTDVSATTGTYQNRVWVIIARNADGTPVGARYHGDTVAPTANQNNTLTLISKVDSTGHMDFYRNAATQSTYSLVGYFS